MISFTSILQPLFLRCLPILALIILCWLCIIVPQKWQQQYLQLLKQAIKPGSWITTSNGVEGRVIDLQDQVVRIMCSDGALKQINTNTLIRVDNEKK